MRATVPILLAAGLLAACQQTTPTQVRTGEGMVDPATGQLDPVFIDGSFSLSILIEEHLRQPLQNSDRREIDGAVDAALASSPQSPPVSWRNPVRRHEGFVDLVSWRIDARAGELCGVLQHETRLDKTLRGSVTICRASIDPAWRVDEVVWDKPVAGYTPPTPSRPKPAPVTPVPVSPPVAQPNPQPQPQPTPPNYGPGSDPGPQPNPANKNCTPQTGGGSFTLGDCLAPPSS